MEWNITCSLVNNDTSRLQVAEILEQSVYDGLDPLLTKETIELVYVYELCDETVANHNGATSLSRRRLETLNATEIKFYLIVSRACNACDGEMFNETNEALIVIVDNGSLSNDIQNKSGNEITAVISPGSVNSTYNLQANSPTGNPSVAPTPQPTGPTVSTLYYLLFICLLL